MDDDSNFRIVIAQLGTVVEIGTSADDRSVVGNQNLQTPISTAIEMSLGQTKKVGRKLEKMWGNKPLNAHRVPR